MNLQPTLYKDNLNIKPLVSADYEEMYSAASDPAIWAGMPAKNRWKKTPFTKWFEFMVDVGSLTIREQDKIIGATRYYIMPEDRLFMGSTFLIRDCWGGDYNWKFRYMLIDYAFEYYDKVHIHMTHDNKRNIRATEKLGFTYVYDEEVFLGFGKKQNFMTFLLDK